MKGKFIDLHVHTNFSDGFDSIATVIKKAKQNDVGVLSLTEHYNISSYKIACELAGDDIEIIPGIELGTDMSKYNENKKHVCHIVAYFVSYDICKVLDMYEIERYECVVKTLELLRKQNINITMSDVLEYARDKKSVGRFDIARALKKLGYTKSTAEAYGRYLEHGGQSYVKRKKLKPFELIQKIIECGGVPVLAHPKSLRFSEEQEDEFISKLVESGLCGIEVYNSNIGDDKRLWYLELCNKYNLIPTVGSDYHGGRRKPVLEIGKGKNGNLNVSDMSIIERLKKKKEEIDELNSKKQ